MSENLHNIDKLFKNAIEDHEELPSGQVWNNIDKRLDKNNVVSIQKKYYVLKRVAVAVFIFGFVASVFAIYYNRRFDNTAPQSGNRSVNQETIAKTKEKPAQRTSVNNISDQPSSKFDQNSNHTNAVTVVTSSTASNRSDAALSSEEYKKINKETSPSYSPAIPATKNKNNLIPTKDEKIQIAGNLKWKNKIEIVSNQPQTKDISIQSEDHIRESIVANHLLYAFQPAFSKTFSHSNIAPETFAPISKLKKQPHIAVTVFAGPEKNITHLKDPPQPMRAGTRDDFRHSEQSKSSIRTGILIEYPFTSNWSIASGIIYSSSITSIAPKVVFARPDDRGNIKYEFNCSAGYAYIPAKTGSTPLIGDSAKVFNSKTRISYISIPVTAGYNLSAGKFIIKPSVGLLFNFLTNGKVESVISSNSMNQMNSTNSISGLKSNYQSAEINVTAIYQINNKIGIMLAPVSQFALTSINKNTSVKTYPGYVGVTGGIRVGF